MDITQFMIELWNARLAIMNGVINTIIISLSAVLTGSLLGVLVGLGLSYGMGFLRFFIRLYTDFLRGTPVFVLILACFYISSVIGLKLSAFEAGILSLSLFCSSHVGEIVRGALSSIAKGQTEAAKSIGLTFTQTFTSVLMPQALRQILPTWVNTATEIVKASTLLSIIGVVETLLSIQQVISRTYLSLEFYLFAGFVYFLINFLIEQLGQKVERRITLPK